MKHLQKIKKVNDLIELRKQSIDLHNQLTKSTEYYACDYYIVASDVYKSFLLIHREDKKQLAKGTASELKKYIILKNIDFNNIFDVKLIGINYDKDELLPFNKHKQLLDDSLNTMYQLKDSIELEKCDYILKKDDTFPYRYYFLISKDGMIRKQHGTLVQIKKYIQRIGVDVGVIFQGEILNDSDNTKK